MTQPSQPEPKFQGVEFILRTQQADYLRYIADRDSTTLSAAFGAIVENYRSRQMPLQARSPQKIRTQLYVATIDRDFLDGLAIVLGVYRSDVARRLIDDAVARDDTV